jgi:hypothetical protein
LAVASRLLSLPLFSAACFSLGFGLTLAIVAESPHALSSSVKVRRPTWLRLGALLCAACATIPVAALLLSPQDPAYTAWAWPWAVAPLLGIIILAGVESWRSTGSPAYTRQSMGQQSANGGRSPVDNPE